MSAFLKIDRCRSCQQELAWEFVPPLSLGGRVLAGTGVWRSALVDDLCAACVDARELAQRRQRYAQTLRDRFIRLVGGPKPYRDFSFDRYRVMAGNQLAFQSADQFDPSTSNLYLWGSCGVGKTHLAVAILRRWFARGASIAMVTPFQLVRRLRMKPPDEEQHALDGFVSVKVLLIDDVGVGGGETSFGRQVLQEILDGRHFQDRDGLVITSPCSPDALTHSLSGAIASRLAGMCRVIEVRGSDKRLMKGVRND